ncbi:hypothetical protein BDY21DRAFT_124929 [Lineolata rhizophorae]|uniref:RING-type domain-containing protein n=1 Tax=Lineolata rhizophorae TaxID=578093 RepID=A0A6A6NP25_9PEZI|nr:hypothetical protein BDY21DRAFT_124929 [Lineolata rhizophorae]
MAVLAARQEEPNSEDSSSSSTAVAIVLPALFILILLVLVVMFNRAFLLPRIYRPESPESKAKRRQQRISRLDKFVKSENFHEWCSKHTSERPGQFTTTNPLCVICLDEIEDSSQIRGLGCLHVFHQHCLDDWFARFNEFCPLCHRPIVQQKAGRFAKVVEQQQRRRSSSVTDVAVSAMV